MKLKNLWSGFASSSKVHSGKKEIAGRHLGSLNMYPIQVTTKLLRKRSFLRALQVSAAPCREVYGKYSSSRVMK
ncbi:hypothetical protein D3C78_613080 [compost metagenome]